MDSSPVLALPARPGHPRNSEGAFLTLKNGRILFAYSHYLGASWQDHARADIVARESADGGLTWSAEDRIIVANEGGCNVMSVSLLRLPDSRIALFYLRKNSARDCRPYLRTSADEGATWSEASCCAPSVGYYVVNNDRILHLASGRLIIPAASHRPKNPADPHDPAIEAHAEDRFFLSDDDGATWRENSRPLQVSPAIESGLQEPGLIERRDGSLYGWARTSAGQQWEFESRDGGETWSEPRPSRFTSPCSPLSIKNLGSHAEPLWLAVWNDPSALGAAVHQEKVYAESTSWGRTPLVAAFSRDEGAGWSEPHLLEDDPARGFCYTAIHRTGDAVLLAYCCGGRGTAVLQDLCIRRLKLHD